MAQRNSRLIAGIYQVGQTIASGPLLTTYTAYNRNTSDVVGLLVIELPPGLEPGIVQQVLAPLERRRQAQSQHVIHVYDWGFFEGRAYIATDPPRGITLNQLEDNENIDLARALDLATQMARGVAVLQSYNIIDTDLRPQLITVDTIGLNDRVQLDDVGLRSIFRQLGYVQGLAISDIGYLDPRYMAPESIFQSSISSASDVYQLGIMLFELVTGRPPFVGRTPAETGMLQSNSPVPRMAQFKHETPPELQAVVECAMAKNPQQRYPHAAALLAALEAVPRVRKLTTTGPWQAVTTRPGELLASVQGSSPTTSMISLPQNTPIEAIDTLIGKKASAPSNETAFEQANLDPGDTLLENVESQALDSTTGGTLVPEDAQIYAYLDYEQPGEETQRLPVTGKYVIVGRADPKRGIMPEVDLTQLDAQATVSRQHARLRFEKTFFYIEDLKSRNKTRLSQLVLRPLKPELIQHGDEVWFGSVRMVFRLPGKRDTPLPKNLP
ncbi:MAG TPA: FHA domain-containing serine/threonine-protein kinase [Ktedonobacteraceae bacterium]|nr:FHA domain-containing serine/threonine-protein kinase [Ktedonobacteraceae bacterium]